MEKIVKIFRGSEVTTEGPEGQEGIGAGAGGFFTTGAVGGAPAKYPPGWK